MGIINLGVYLVLRNEYMRNKRFEKLLERRRKIKESAQLNIEQADLLAKEDNLYTNKDGTIDWKRLAKHVSEATSGRQQS